MSELDYSSKSKEELISLCKENNIKGYSGKKKDDIIALLKTPVIQETNKKNMGQFILQNLRTS